MRFVGHDVLPERGPDRAVLAYSYKSVVAVFRRGDFVVAADAVYHGVVIGNGVRFVGVLNRMVFDDGLFDDAAVVGVSDRLHHAVFVRGNFGDVRGIIIAFIKFYMVCHRLAVGIEIIEIHRDLVRDLDGIDFEYYLRVILFFAVRNYTAAQHSRRCRDDR